MKISRVSEMRRLDEQAVKEYGISEELLMENAGQAAYFAILNELGVAGNSFAIFCGVGNNGGDGLVVARKLHSNGAEVTVFILGDRNKFKGAAKQNFNIAKKLGLRMVDLREASQAEVALATADAVVDALFGTGLTREVEGLYREVIELINDSGVLVFSLDIPSGINGDTGQVMGVAVEADFTITFGLPKVGNLLYPGFEHGGELFVTHISFPPELHDSPELKIAVSEPAPLPPRVEDSHKGSYGKALFIAGSSQYLGAPYFAALSFLKAGGGLSFLATPTSVSSFIASKGSEIIILPQEATPEGSMRMKARAELLEFSQNVDFVVMGPGLSLNVETQEMVRRLAAEIDKPLLIDGDGLTAVAQNPDCLKKRTAPTVLTPHPGEMARLTQKEISEIAANRIEVVQETAETLRATIVLKGAHSLIGHPDGRVYVNLSGNPGMATAGSGDVLAGTIAAMFGLGLPFEEAVRTGVFMHGFAGDLAAESRGEDGTLAGDIMHHLPVALRAYRAEYATLTEDYYHTIFTV